MSTRTRPIAAKSYIKINARTRPAVERSLLEQVWITIIEEDGTENSYNLPRKLAELI